MNITHSLKKEIALIIMVLFIGVTIVQSNINGNLVRSEEIKNIIYIPLNDDEKIITSVQDNEGVIIINYQISDFTLNELDIDGDRYFKISLENESNIMVKGRPEIPNICRSIIIPDNLKMNIRVTHLKYEDYKGIKISPSKGHLNRTINPQNVPYVFDEAYAKDCWFPHEIAELDDPYIMRDFRGQVIKINPFQYNPTKEILRFFTDITIEVYPAGSDTVNCITTRTEPSLKINKDFNQIYKKHFINFNTNYYSSIETHENMLIVTYDDFWNTMVPFVQWKNMKGVFTEMINISEIGGADALKNYISDYYDANGLTYVLLVGDADQVHTIYARGASDPSYSYIAGRDHYPDLFVGRFSAENISDVETQVERSIEYEKYPQKNCEWYHNGTGIASKEGPGDDGERDNVHMDNIRDDLLSYTYEHVDQFYGRGASENDVAMALNAGRGIINYCGHGSMKSWGTTGFNNIHINALTNDNMLPFITSVACSNGNFHMTTCFAEAWLRATHNGEPTGAIAAFMSSITQSWDPPMDAQDEIIDILIESYDDKRITTFGSLVFNGCMHMNDEYGSKGYMETDAWHVFGDPSLQVRTDIPDDIIVSHNKTIEIGSTMYELEVPGVEDALCAISYGYKLLGCGYANETGHVIISFDEPVTNDIDSLDLVVTGYNKIPLIDSIEVLKPEVDIGVITGGLSKVSAIIKNSGGLEANDVGWNISIAGHAILFGKETSGTIHSIPAGGQITVNSGLVLGFGSAVLTITVDMSDGSFDTKQHNIFVLLSYIWILADDTI